LNPSSGLPYRTALVTGGAGFIGSHIVDALVEAGCRTTVIDDVSTGSATNLNAAASLVTHDIADPDVARLVEEIAPEVVIHAAAQASVPLSMEDPARDRSVNLDGTRHVLEGARRAGVKRIVFLSSGGAVYGSTDGATEMTVPAPESYYGIHKLAAEAYVALSGIPYANLRLANIYGPRQRPGLEGAVVAVFSSRVASGLPVKIHGDGQQSRDFVYVADVVGAV
jgi:UDP-glucose 4-epimerase